MVSGGVRPGSVLVDDLNHVVFALQNSGLHHDENDDDEGRRELLPCVG